MTPKFTEELREALRDHETTVAQFPEHEFSSVTLTLVEAATRLLKVIDGMPGEKYPRQHLPDEDIAECAAWNALRARVLEIAGGGE